jgi:secondary thiamine-phosphate synthase enzyme
MTTHLHTIRFSTPGPGTIRDLSDEVQSAIAASGVVDGIVCVSAVGSTMAITTIEYESGLVRDLQDALERLAPSNIPYAHDARWHDGNGHSHIRASLLGPSVCLPVVDGAMAVGTWQQVIAIEMDVRPRDRSVLVQVLGG